MKKQMGWAASVVLTLVLVAGGACITNDDAPKAHFGVVSSDGEVLQAIDSMRAARHAEAS